MVYLLWDASALAKRYVAEVGSQTVNAVFAAIPPAQMVTTIIDSWVPGRVTPEDCSPRAFPDPYVPSRAYGPSRHELATGRYSIPYPAPSVVVS